MSEWQQNEHLASFWEDLTTLVSNPVPETLREAFESTPKPTLAITNFTRWLAGTSSPGFYFEQLAATPRLATIFANLLGASQPITDSLIQNPELASLLFDPTEVARVPSVDSVIEEGRRMLATTSSPSHRLDRLRYLKQRWTLPIVINDLAGIWNEELVWQSLSYLAEALIVLCAETIWADYASSKGVTADCPVMIVGFGKLGGNELNFSSDIDLVYVLPDGLDDELERHAFRFCELFGRGLSDRMGRGSLYRVDLRLRPYGGTGPIAASMRAHEAYYQLYAEQWEVQALIRSKPVYDGAQLGKRWMEMRRVRCFRDRLSELEIASMVEMKTRIEERADDADIKRGAGGIRDVEFIVQALQLIHGGSDTILQGASTIKILGALENLNIVESPVAECLREGYVFLRQLEHRCQLLGDQQTHSIPTSPEARRLIAHLMSHPDWPALKRHLDIHRKTIQGLYRSILQPASAHSEPRDLVSQRLGSLAPGVLQWFDSFPEAESFYAVLAENRDSLDRISAIAINAPRLVNDLKRALSTTEMLVSGEIEEDETDPNPYQKLDLQVDLAAVAAIYANARLRVLVRWALIGGVGLAGDLTRLLDSLLTYLCRRSGASYDLIALGSYGAKNLSPDSDADVVLLVSNASDQPQAEAQAQQLLAMIGQIRRMGVDLQVDLRLRPDGGKGLLVRSMEALRQYDLQGIEVWERFALGQARLVFGSHASVDGLRELAHTGKLNPNQLQELLDMKARIENERVPPSQGDRQIKLGHGSLSDVEWTVRLLEMQHDVTPSDPAFDTRILELMSRGHLTDVDAQILSAALRHLTEQRVRLFLLCFEKDLIPVEEEKLSRLATAAGYDNRDAFLEVHHGHIRAVRAIYLHTVERLNA